MKPFYDNLVCHQCIRRNAREFLDQTRETVMVSRSEDSPHGKGIWLAVKFADLGQKLSNDEIKRMRDEDDRTIQIITEPGYIEPHGDNVEHLLRHICRYEESKQSGKCPYKLEHFLATQGKGE